MESSNNNKFQSTTTNATSYRCSPCPITDPARHWPEPRLPFTRTVQTNLIAPIYFFLCRSFRFVSCICIYNSKSTHNQITACLAIICRFLSSCIQFFSAATNIGFGLSPCAAFFVCVCVCAVFLLCSPHYSDNPSHRFCVSRVDFQFCLNKQNIKTAEIINGHAVLGLNESSPAHLPHIVGCFRIINIMYLNEQFIDFIHDSNDIDNLSCM